MVVQCSLLIWRGRPLTQRAPIPKRVWFAWSGDQPDQPCKLVYYPSSAGCLDFHLQRCTYGHQSGKHNFILEHTVVNSPFFQKVDYDRLWSVPDPVYLSSDPGRGKGYQFMNMPEVDLSGRRTSTLTRPPTILSNPAFGMEKH